MSRPTYDERWFFPALDRPGVLSRWTMGTVALVMFGTIVLGPVDLWPDRMLSLVQAWFPLSFILLLVFGYGYKWLQRLPIAWSWVSWMVVTITVSLSLAAWDPHVPSTVGGLATRVFRDVFFVLLLLFLFDGQRRRGSDSWAQARLDSLQARMRPHFLFNTLNGLAEIVRSDPDLAEEALLDLADLSRAMLQPAPLVSAAQERECADAYLRLEALRMADRLRVTWDWTLDPNARIPALLLQPLLENAIKHGVEPLHEGGDVLVKGWQEGRYVYVFISNPCDEQASDTAGHGVTLPNLEERLQWLYPDTHRFRTRTLHGRFEVSLRFPYRTDSA